MIARHTPASALRRSVREAAARTDQPATTALRPTIDPSTDPTTDKKVQMSITISDPRSSLHMQLMPEALARVHMQERLQEAEHERLIRALRLRTRAERMTLRARKALASVVMQ